MNKALIILAATVLIIVLGTGLFLSITSKKIVPTNTSTSINTTTNNTPSGSGTVSSNELKSAFVQITGNGFVPTEVVIAPNTQVIWTNNSGKPASVNSDSYPTNLIWPFLNLGSFENGENVSVSFDKTGTYTYHNNYDPNQKGTITVK